MCHVLFSLGDLPILVNNYGFCYFSDFETIIMTKKQEYQYHVSFLFKEIEVHKKMREGLAQIYTGKKCGAES